VPKKCIGSLRSICSYFVYDDGHRQHSKPRFTVLSMMMEMKWRYLVKFRITTHLKS
jgi:hypothetical protein